MEGVEKIKKQYSDRLEALGEVLKGVQRKMALVATVRLSIFVATAFALYWTYDYGASTLAVVGLGGTAFFLFFLKQHVRLRSERAHLQALITINENEIRALQGDLSPFDQGFDLVNPEHPFSYDLDLFGEGAMFPFLNRSGTLSGREKLSEWLQNPLTESQLIRYRQEAVRELSSKVEWRQDFQATGKLSGEKSSDRSALLDWVNRPDRIAVGWTYKIILWLVPITSLVMLALAVLNVITVPQYLLSLALPFGIIGNQLRSINHQYGLVNKVYGVVKSYARILKAIETVDFESEKLRELQENLKQGGRSAGEGIAQLSSIISALDNRNNPFAALVLNGLFLWDLQYIVKLQKWQDDYRSELPIWIEMIGEMDSFCSIANMAHNYPGFQFPELTASEGTLEATAFGHPLLGLQDCVTNDFKLNGRGQFVILTGANMSGKSTFLRTIGVNMVLAMIGAPVFATSMKLTPVPLFSSMRTSDSLQNQQSYFYSELMRLKSIVDRLNSGNPLFIILDEILKGTNSADKEKGSSAFVKRMIRLQAQGIIATHDLSLCKLADDFPSQIVNKRFEVEMKGDDLSFDYLLREGVCQNMNASFLMDKMGITSEK